MVNSTPSIRWLFHYCLNIVLTLSFSGKFFHFNSSFPLKTRHDVKAAFVPDHSSVLQGQRERPHRDRAAFCGLHQWPPSNTPWSQPQRYTHTATQTQLAFYIQMLSVCECRDEASSPCLYTLTEREPLHEWGDSCQSKRSSSPQQMAKPSPWYVNTEFITCLRHGLCDYHSASADSAAHLLFFR